MHGNVFMIPSVRAHCYPWWPIVLLLMATAIALVGCGSGDSGNSGKKHKQRQAASVPVAVKTVKPGTVDIYATYPGRIRGAREVEVRSRVAGILLRRHYNEGEFVETGQLLFTINPASFEATVEQRKAQLQKAKANLDQAREVWQRVSHLYAINAASEAKRDGARAKLETAQAEIHLAKANLKAARIKLDYTTIEAPLSGVTSLEEVDVGALVTPGTLLTTITQLDPVHVRFSIPAEDALMRKKALAAVTEGVGATRAATLILPSGKKHEQTGFVDFTQSTIDPSTGTVHLRAVFDNADHELVPGRFVSVRIRLGTRHDAIVVPNKAIADSQTQTQVYIVNDDDKAKPVAVKLGPTVAQGRIIAHGLKAGDRVIVIGLGQVKPGSKVTIKPREKLAIGHQPGQTEEADVARGGKGKPTTHARRKKSEQPKPTDAASTTDIARQDN